MKNLIFSAMTGFLMLSQAAWGDQNVSCDVGKCTKIEDNYTFLYEDGKGRTRAGFYVVEIENGTEGPNAGTFNMISSFKVRDQGKLQVFFEGSGPYHFEGDLVMTVYHPESVAGTSVNISQNAKEGLGDFRHIEAVFDIDLTPAAGETILYEIQGSVKKQNVDTKRVPQGPRFSVNIFEK